MMNPQDSPNLQPPIVAEIVPSRRRGWSIAAWLVIAGLVSLILFLPERLPEQPVDEALEPLALRIMEVQGQWVVATSQWLATEQQRDDLYDDVRALDTGPIAMQLRFVTLAGELQGPAEALVQLRELRDSLSTDELEATEQQRRALRLLERLYDAYEEVEEEDEPAAAEIPAADQQFLVSQLGWFGRLALHPPQGPDTAARQRVLAQAQQTMVIVLMLMAVGSAVSLAGVAGFGTFTVLWLNGQLRSRLHAPDTRGGIYAETFALWMSLFVGSSIVVSLMQWRGQPLLMNLLVAVGSLVALAWPRLRGIAWRELWPEIGLHRGRGVLREMGWGIVCYVSALPLLFAAMLLLLVLIWLSSLGGTPDEVVTPEGPGHPIVSWLVEASWWEILQVVILASVIAPIVEEIFFRGVLYRHLRSATSTWRITASVLYSGLVSSLLFAVIHPQGWLGVPMLTSLAFAFSLTREWRGSLIAPMTAHALNNAVATTVLLSLLA